MVSLQAVLDMILGITPVPGLSLAFNTLKLVVFAVQQASTCKHRLAVLTQSAAHLLQTLNAEFSASRLVQSACSKPLNDLHSLLIDIEAFVSKEQARPFFKALWSQEERLEGIEGFHRRIGAVAAAFQIAALLNIQRMLVNDRQAHNMYGQTILHAGQVGSANLMVSQASQPAVIFQPHSPGGSPPSNVRPPLPRQRIKPVVILQPPSPGGSPPSNARSPLPRQRIKPVVILQPPSPGGSPPSNARSPLPRQRIYLGRKTPYAGLSTRSPHPVTYNGKQYPTAEHLFQAFKFMDNRPDIAEYIRTVSTEKACQYGESYKTHRHPDWDKMKTYQMEITLWHKFSQNAELKKILLGTGDAELVHFATGPFWAVGKDYNGRNEYGKALERVRSGLRET